MKEMQNKKMTVSFEVFPPKTVAGMEALCGEGGVLQRLYTLNPDTIACTYGAGGSDIGKNMEILDRIARDGKCTPLTHLTCIGNTAEGLKAQLQTYLNHGITHMLALRGDLPTGWTGSSGEMHSASRLVSLARREFGSRFTIAVAGAPEGLRSISEDVLLLQQKQDSGADFIITRLCWDLEQFYRWLDAILGAGIRMPITAGVMPVVDQAETINMVMSRRGSDIPRDLSALISRNWIYPNPFVRDPFDAEAEQKKASFRAAGIDYTLRQIEAYRACGVSGIHLHTRNRFEDVAGIAADAGLI